MGVQSPCELTAAARRLLRRALRLRWAFISPTSHGTMKSIFHGQVARIGALGSLSGRTLRGVRGVWQVLRAGVFHENGSPLNRVAGPAIGRTSVDLM